MEFLHRINYMKYAKTWLAISIVLTVISVAAFGFLGLNKGIDFTGGLLYDIQFEQAVTSQQVKDAASKAITTDVAVQKGVTKGAESTDASEFFVRTPELSKEQQDQLKQGLEQLGTYKVISEDQVSGTVSGELRDKAILAVLIASVLQIIYLWFRFELSFGVTAVIALLHDVIITIGAVALFRIQINSAFVAAILTILGYSINDTVIVFDRIRENLRSRKKGEALHDLVTRSIQEVITRSIYTVFTVQFTLLALLVWGGETLKDFTLTLLIGITSGMYSSIFIAASLWLFWHEVTQKNKKPSKAKMKPART